MYAKGGREGREAKAESVRRGERDVRCERTNRQMRETAFKKSEEMREANLYVVVDNDNTDPE